MVSVEFGFQPAAAHPLPDVYDKNSRQIVESPILKQLTMKNITHHLRHLLSKQSEKNAPQNSVFIAWLPSKIEGESKNSKYKYRCPQVL